MITAGEYATVGEIVQLFETHRIKRVPIVRDGRVVGIVSRANLLQGLIAGAAQRPAPLSADDRGLREAIQATLHREFGMSAQYADVVVAEDQRIYGARSCRPTSSAPFVSLPRARRLSVP
jgi:CBS-domain-containing membrane protein